MKSVHETRSPNRRRYNRYLTCRSRASWKRTASSRQFLGSSLLVSHSVYSNRNRPEPRLTAFLALTAVICFLWGARAFAASGISAQHISLGIISETNRAQIEERFSDFVRYVAAKLDPASRVEGKVLIAPTAFELARMIEQRQVDFYIESPYPTYLVNNVHGVARLLLRRWKGGMAEYRSLIFTKRSSAISRLEDLRGKVIAFEDPESTSGYFLPHAFLKRKGFSFSDRSRFDPYASPTDVGYLFAYSQDQLMDWVLSQKTAAGAFSNDDYTRLDKKPRAETAILAETDPVPRHLLSVRNDLPQSLTDRLKKILLSMHENDEGRKILKRTDDTTKFDVLPEGELGLRRKFEQIFDTAKDR